MRQNADQAGVVALEMQVVATEQNMASTPFVGPQLVPEAAADFSIDPGQGGTFWLADMVPLSQATFLLPEDMGLSPLSWGY